ncbi:8-amino-7-oxononanoate synthase [Westerdykella ornata]|uniref:8-amino-7-oxononanoate synthase n=1 Tax=Westerdykella ornata TaxID=318751 RepID=A0A6A6J9E2_WESOR|nr:8-amino-7-oxononanoate synthase [Westerdykella ornata]KAF2272256.1 8-amino-7-oxononanoate synthase [Westerdykella ornata]
MYADRMLTKWLQDLKPRAAAMKDQPVFYRNLEQAMDISRADRSLIVARPRWDDSVLDFTSSDFLSFSRSGRIREAFLEELGRHEEFRLSASGSRVQYGNYDYLIQVEQEIADFHGAEAAYIAHSGFMANAGTVAAVPLPGDAIVYDDAVHASTHEGLKLSLASHQLSFRHNDPDALHEVLSSLKKSHKAFELGTSSILIAVESVYSMDGDICPLEEMVQVAKEVFPLGNAQFIVDEAHSNGVIGPRGAGLVNMLGLEKEIAIRIHMCSKALGSTGGVILCNKTVRARLISNARFAIYSGAPSFPMVASMRAGYRLLENGEAEKGMEKIQTSVRHFLKTITAHPVWDEAVDEGILNIPLAEDYESNEHLTHIVPVLTRPKHEVYLFFHLIINNINAYPISFPVVPKGKSRVRLVFHAHNSLDQAETLANVICEWAQEMLDIEAGKTDNVMPSAARKVYAMKT